NLGSAAATPPIAFRQLGGGTLTTFTGPSVASAAAWVFDPRYQNGVAGGTLCGAGASPGCFADGEYSFSVSASGANLTAAVNVISPSTAMGYIALAQARSEEHTSELQSLRHLVCRLLLEKKKKK